MIGKRVSVAFVGKAVVASAVLALVACGGGGGGGGGGSSSSSSTTGSSGGSSSSGGPAVITNYAAGGSLSLYSGSLGGYGYNNASGSAARFDEPFALARDTNGDIYVADYYDHTIRKVTASGTVSTFAGKPYVAGHVDGSTGNARFNGPAGMAISNGVLYVADVDDQTIRKISGGVVSTLAGLSGISGSADGMTAAARFNSPKGLALDSFGNLFVADSVSHTIRKVSSAGAVSTFAGFAGSMSGSNGTGSSARFASPEALTVDASNNVYVGDYNGIRKITAAGLVTTPVTSSDLSSLGGCNGIIAGLAVDAGGSIYVSTGTRICKVASNGTISFLAGSGNYDVVDGTGASASFYTKGMLINASGDTLYLADRFAVRQLSIATATVSTIAGKGYGDRYGFLDGAVASAKFKQPYGIAADALGRLLVTDSVNFLLRRIEAGTVSSLAGTAGGSGTADGSGTAGRFSSPSSVATDANGNAYVADGNAIRKISAAGAVSTLAGNITTAGTSDGNGTAARFNDPDGLSVDSLGNVFVVEGNSHTIRKITAAGVVTTFCGLAGTSGSTDGNCASARFNRPHDITQDSSGNLYVTDTLNRTVRKITAAGVVTTLAGSAGTAGYIDGPLAASRFTLPTAITIDATGNLYIVDYIDAVVRKISTAGQVTTVVGSSDGRWIAATGSLPGHLNVPNSMAVIGKKLYITDENAVLVADIP
ncbi:hypothetical protein GCM10027046_02960 [Uliginosibacterium flavum]|uniref:NHL repeat-containing protein n=1 Tax=Uliginosibacterium flavum TaxID=1396831 RepID=A0ABV2THU5_9RHOO